MKSYYWLINISLAVAMSFFACQNNSREYSDAIYDEHFEINKVAQKPPMGWNSWDVFGTSVTEDEVKAMADYMAENLKQFGYEYIVIDLGWYAPDATAVGHQYHQMNNARPHQLIDEYGRLIPSPNRFPSCKDGFKPLADYVHSKGLKFGIHIMRGIPVQAVEQDKPIKGSQYTAKDVFRYQDRCVFYSGMYSMKTNHPGSMAYYQSLLDMYAGWGVDFIKSDDMARYPKSEHLEEFILFRKALENTGRPITLSLSPGGGVTIMDRSVLNHYADMFRISGDFWDEWPDLKDMFRRCRTWQQYTGPGSWADCDMIPLGVINIRAEHGDGPRNSLFTLDEQYTLMSLWSIFRSPLMLGMDMTQLDSTTLSLLTTEKVLDINQNSTDNREIYSEDDIIVWQASNQKGSEKYFAVFNLSDESAVFNLTDKELMDIPSGVGARITNNWTGDNIELEQLQYIDLSPHGVLYFSLQPE